MGRFLSADTIVPDGKNPQSLNRFSYTRNNPLNYIDPTGHFDETELIEYGVDEDWLTWVKQNHEDWYEFLMFLQFGDSVEFCGWPGGNLSQFYGVATLARDRNNLSLVFSGPDGNTTFQDFFASGAFGLESGTVWRPGINNDRTLNSFEVWKNGQIQYDSPWANSVHWAYRDSGFLGWLFLEGTKRGLSAGAGALAGGIATHYLGSVKGPPIGLAVAVFVDGDLTFAEREYNRGRSVIEDDLVVQYAYPQAGWQSEIRIRNAPSDLSGPINATWVLMSER